MSSQVQISRILHAGYVFQSGDIQIAFDPIFENPFSRNCYAFPNVSFDYEQIKRTHFSAVFISHYHDDHCSLESLNYIDRKTPIYIYCIFEELTIMLKEMGFQTVIQLELNSSVQIGDFEIIPRQALDSDVDSLFQIKVSGLNILNVVDSWIDDSTLDLLVQQKPWDLILWPFQTMREIEVLTPSRVQSVHVELPEEWVAQLKQLNPRYIIPSSCQFIQENWSWYNKAMFPISYKKFHEDIEIALPNSKVIRLNPSCSIILDKQETQFVENLKWVHPIGDQNIDYEYDPNIIAPTTAVVSKQFPALTFEEEQLVDAYCNNEILKKYKTFESPSDIYFKKPRLWKLSTFDNIGSIKKYYYIINQSQIEVAEPNCGLPLSWSTELPAYKLLSALKHGEALTSMYMRINDVVFSPEIEKELQDVDVMEDPLVRCLFNQAFGSYQRAQLEKIKERNQG
jgi:hypothetical protein